MKWFWNPCRRRRREICLFAAGALPEKDRPEMEQHLAACSDCRIYYREIKTLAAPLAGWEKNFAHIEPTQAMRNRWAGAVQESEGRAGNPLPAAARKAARTECAPYHPGLAHSVWRELIWPCRRAWVGLAALWLVLLAVNVRLSDHPMQMAGGRSSSASDMMQSWEAQTRLMAELTQPPVAYSSPVKPPIAPANLPRPRSERKQDWQIV